jgi:hypothetical protein
MRAPVTPLVLLLLVELTLLPARAPAADFARECRALFEKLIDFKLEGNLLVIKETVSAEEARTLLQAARGSFSVGRFYFRAGSTSSSSSGGGEGSVTLHFLPGSQPGSFQFNLAAPGGKDVMNMSQPSPGLLTLEYQSGARSVSYSQSKGKCRLRIKAGRDSVLLSRSTFTAILQAEPVAVRKHLVEAIESFFGEVPVVRASGAPPGKVLFHLRDGTLLVGTVDLEKLDLATDYGTLTLPRGEIRQIVFPNAKEGSASSAPTVVVMERFSPSGALALESFAVKTAYGALDVPLAKVAHVVFGPPLAPPASGG